MDPINRKKSWEFIRTLRMNRAILLTTHCMTEADALSDRIAIIKKGKLECIGTSLALKNEFGSGYIV